MLFNCPNCGSTIEYQDILIYLSECDHCNYEIALNPSVLAKSLRIAWGDNLTALLFHKGVILPVSGEKLYFTGDQQTSADIVISQGEDRLISGFKSVL